MAQPHLTKHTRVASRLASAHAGRAPRAAPFDGSTVRHHCAASRAAPSRTGCRRDRGRLGTNSPFRGPAGTPASQARSDRSALARYGFVRTSRRPSGLPSRIILPSPRSGGRGPLVTTRSHGGAIRLLRIAPPGTQEPVLALALVVLHGAADLAAHPPRD